MQAKTVERHRNGAQQGHGHKGNRPFGAVAHGDGHPVCFLDAARSLQPPGQRVHRRKKTRKRPAVALIDHEFKLAMRPAGVEQVGQAGKSAAVGRHGLTIDRDGFQFKRRTRPGELGATLGRTGQQVV